MSSYRKDGEKGRIMTLIAGMVCTDGIVMAADSEQSGYFRKSNVPKLESCQADGLFAAALSGGSVSGCSTIIGGAGNGELADYAAHKIVQHARDWTSMQEAESKIEEILNDIFGKRFPVYKPEDLSEMRLLIAVKAPDLEKPKLFSSYGSTLVERQKFVLGSGTLVDFILDQTYDSAMTTEDGVAAALSLLQIAKKYVDGVGGDSKVAVLRHDASVSQKPGWEIRDEEFILGQHAQIANKLMLAMMRTRTDSDAVWQANLQKFMTEISDLRQEKKKSDEKIEKMWARYRKIVEEEEERKRKEESKKLPYLIEVPATNVFKKEGNVFTGQFVANAKDLGGLVFKDDKILPTV